MVDTVYTRTHSDGRVETQIYSSDPGRCQPMWKVDEEATAALRKDQAAEKPAPKPRKPRKKATK